MHTHIAFLLDESGSMSSRHKAVIAGHNEFIKELRSDDTGEILYTLGMFDLNAGNKILRLHQKAQPLDSARALKVQDYSPRGSTPLNDAVLQMIKTIDNAKKKQDKAMLVIMTDGEENASEADAATVSKAIANKEAEGWEFIYLGAEHDAWAQSSQFGMAAQGQTFAYAGDAESTSSSMSNVAMIAKSYSTLDMHDHKAGTAMRSANIDEDDEAYDEQIRAAMEKKRNEEK